MTSRPDDVAEVCRCRLTTAGRSHGQRRAARLHDGELVGAIPARLLTDECPRYRVPSSPKETQPASPPLEPNLRSREWIYERYDQLVGRARSGGRPRRRRAPAASVVPWAGGLPGRPPSASVTRSRRSPGRARRRAERRLRRRGADRAHRLPQLRQPREAEIAWELEQAIEESRRPPRRSGSRSSPETSRSTTTPKAARSRRRRSWAASASSPMSGASRKAGAEGTRAGVRAPSNSLLLDLEAEAELIRLVWRATPSFACPRRFRRGLEVAIQRWRRERGAK